MKLRVTGLVLLLISLFSTLGCGKKETYGSPETHTCINCGNTADVYLNKTLDSDSNVIDVYLCNECKDEYLENIPIVDHDAVGKKYPWVE